MLSHDFFRDRLFDCAKQSHPIWEELCSALQFCQVGKTKQVRARRHINIGEVRAAIKGEEYVARRFPGQRYVHLQDSQVSLACFVKGRSSSPSLNRELRRSLGCYLASRARPSFGYFQSKLNPSDDPTRSAPLRSPSKPAASWLLKAWQGDFGELDDFLQSLGLRPRQLAGLPDESELWPDAPLAEVPKASTKKLRAPLSPEQRASLFLRRCHVGAAEALEVFRRLPKEVSARSSGWSRAEGSFTAGVFVHGGVTGLRRNCQAFPASVQLLTRVLREAKPGFVFSSVSVSQNVRTLPHVDKNNLSTEPNVVLPLSRFRGGGLWVLSEGGSTPLRHKGKELWGEVLPVSERAIAFDPHRLHATQAWTGSRVVLVGYTVRGCEKLTSEQRAAALSLGFVLPPETRALVPSTELTEEALEPVRAPPKLSADKLAEWPLRVEPASFVSFFEFPGDEPSGLPWTSTLPVPRSGFSNSSPREILLAMPPGRFVISSVFPDLDSALSSAPGWLDLFSGSRGFAKALAAAAPCWILCLDTCHAEDEDLLRPDLQNLLLGMLAGKVFAGVSAGPVCSSFSAAITPAWRSREY